MVVLVLALRTGSNTVRWTLALGLGLGGTTSLLVEPIRSLVDGGSPTAFVASIDVGTAAVTMLRAAHVAAVGVAVVLMFRTPASEFMRTRFLPFPPCSAAGGLPQDLPDIAGSSPVEPSTTDRPR